MPSTPEVEVVGLALEAPSQREFRAEVLKRAITWLGGDGGCCGRWYPSLGPMEEHVAEGLDETANLFFRHWDEVYGVEFSRVVRGARAAGGVAIDTRVLPRPTRSMLAVYADLGRYHLETLCCNLDLSGQPGTVLCVMRSSSALPEFTDRTVALARALLPLLTLGDGLLAKRGRAPADEPPIPRLTRDEQTVARCVLAGFSDDEIAASTHQSIHRVRERRANLFRKARAAEPDVAATARRLALTPRQSQVFEAMVHGRSNKEIAVALGCAESTVELHVTQVFRKAGVSSRLELIASFWVRALPE